jgi:hypothetical protein
VRHAGLAGVVHTETVRTGPDAAVLNSVGNAISNLPGIYVAPLGLLIQRATGGWFWQYLLRPIDKIQTVFGDSGWVVAPFLSAPLIEESGRSERKRFFFWVLSWSWKAELHWFCLLLTIKVFCTEHRYASMAALKIVVGVWYSMLCSTRTARELLYEQREAKVKRKR